jgi:hypothetical protein
MNMNHQTLMCIAIMLQRFDESIRSCIFIARKRDDGITSTEEIKFFLDIKIFVE